MIKPIGKNVSAELEKGSTKTATGILLTDPQAQGLAPKIAKILAVGDGVTAVKAGDKVVFKPYATYEVDLGDKDSNIVMLEEVDILGIIED